MNAAFWTAGRSVSWFRGRRRFGFAAKEPAFQSVDFAFEEMHLLLQLVFAITSTLMLGTPVVGLTTPVDDLQTQFLHGRQQPHHERTENCNGLLQPVNEIGLGLLVKRRAAHDDPLNRNQRSLVRRTSDQRIGAVAIHAPNIVDSANSEK